MSDLITPIEWNDRQFQTPTYLELEKMSDAELIVKQDELYACIKQQRISRISLRNLVIYWSRIFRIF